MFLKSSMEKPKWQKNQNIQSKSKFVMPFRWMKVKSKLKLKALGHSAHLYFLSFRPDFTMTLFCLFVCLFVFFVGYATSPAQRKLFYFPSKLACRYHFFFHRGGGGNNVGNESWSGTQHSELELRLEPTNFMIMSPIL